MDCDASNHLFGDDQQNLIALGLSRLNKTGLLNFGLTKPRFRHSAVELLKSKSSQALTGAAPAATPANTRKTTIIGGSGRRQVVDALSLHGLEPFVANVARDSNSAGHRSGADCCHLANVNKDRPVSKESHHSHFSISSFLRKPTQCKGLNSGSKGRKFVRSNSFDSSVTAIAMTSSLQSALSQTCSTLISRSAAENRNGSLSTVQIALAPQRCNNRDNAAVAAAQQCGTGSCAAAVPQARPKSYTAALLRRKELQAHATGSPQQLVKQQSCPAKPERMQSTASTSMAPEPPISNTRLLFALPSPSVSSPISSPRTAAGVHSSACNSPRCANSNMSGVQHCHLRRSSSSSATCASQCATPVASAASSSFFGRGTSSRGLWQYRHTSSSSSSCSSNSGSCVSGSRISRKEHRGSTGHSLLLSVLDAITLRATTANKHAARHAVVGGAAVDTAAVDDQTAMEQIVLGWYNATSEEHGGGLSSCVDAHGSVCVVTVASSGKQQQQLLQHQMTSEPSSAMCQYTDKATCRTNGILGVGYARLQRGSSCSQWHQREPAGRDASIRELRSTDCCTYEQCADIHSQRKKKHELQQEATSQGTISKHSSSDNHASSTEASQAAKREMPYEDMPGTTAVARAATAEPQKVCSAPGGSATRASAAAVPADSTDRGSVEDLIAASTTCISDLECGFNGMKLTAQHLYGSQLSLRERWAALQTL